MCYGVDPQDALLSQQRDEKEEMKVTRACCRRRSQKLDEMEKNGNCSHPVGEEGGTAWRGVARRAVPAGKNGTAQRNVRGPFVYLFVNEGNETGNLILGLCFPMASPATERMPLGPERSRGT